jgi:hypothetical protein
VHADEAAGGDEDVVVVEGVLDLPDAGEVVPFMPGSYNAILPA